MKRLNYLLIALLASFGVAGAAASSASGFDWQAIEPSAKLIYHKCYQEYKCARLLLPLNWLNETDKRTVAIAITKLPAVVEDDAKSFAGTIFAQPGGPAASGTRYQRRIGHKIQQLVDIPDKKHYEILSFDLRGTGQSEPRINCFPGILNYVRNMQNLINGPLNTSPAALALALASAKADAWQCETVHGDFLSHVSTASIARDMLAILDQVEEMRQKHFSRNDQKLPNSSDAPARMELRSSENATGSITGVPRLKYWGISYGTFIGQTFASMFPGRVGRMIVDGVMDADDIVHEMANGRVKGWLHNTQDTDEIVDAFFQGCFTAGQSRCALCRKTDSSGFDVSRRFWAWAKSLDEQPLAVMAEDGVRIYIRDGDVRAVFLWAMYNAVSESQPLAEDLNEAMHGNTTSLLQRVLDFNAIGPLNAGSDYSIDPIIPEDARTAIVCADGEDVTHYDMSDWDDYLQTQLSISSLAGAFWTTLRLLCAGWRIRPKWSFNGPFQTPQPSRHGENPSPGQPAAPLLFASTLLDPVTPLRNARANSKNHPGAGVLVQNSTGHCLILGPVGDCAKSVVSAYFETGVVPDHEVTCESERSPWDPR